MFARRATAVAANEPWSVEWFERVGTWWRTQRETQGLEGTAGTYAAAAKAQLHVNQVRIIENGLADPEELRSDMLKGYAETLEPGLYDRFSQEFGLTPQAQ